MHPEGRIAGGTGEDASFRMGEQEERQGPKG